MSSEHYSSNRDIVFRQRPRSKLHWIGPSIFIFFGVSLLLGYFALRLPGAPKSPLSPTPQPTLTPTVERAEIPPKTAPQSVNAVSEFTTRASMTEDVRGLGYVDARKIVHAVGGDLFITYRKKDQTLPGKEHMIFVSRSTDNGKTWKVVNDGKAVVQDVGAYDQRVPAIAVDSKQQLHVVWYGVDSKRNGKNQREVKYVTSSDLGETWTHWRNIAPIDSYTGQDYWQEHPSISVGSNDELYVVWEGKDKENPDKQQAKFIASTNHGESWSAPMNVYRTEKHTQSRPSILELHDKSLVIACYSSYQIGGGLQQIQITKSTDGGKTWSKWQNVSNTKADSRHVSMVEDKDNTLHFVWRQQEGEGKSNIYTTSLTAADVTQAAPIASGTESQFFPSLSIADDHLVAAWTETRQFENLPREEVALPATSEIYYRPLQTTNWQKVARFDGGAITLIGRSNEKRAEGIFLQQEDKTFPIIYFSWPIP